MRNFVNGGHTLRQKKQIGYQYGHHIVKQDALWREPAYFRIPKTHYVTKDDQ
jgi:hypothetical protein